MVDELQHGKVPVLDCVREAYRFFQQNLVSLLPACGVVAAGAVLSQLLVGSMPQSVIITLADVAIGMVTSVMLAAAVLRKAIRGETAGAGGVSFGPDEIRLIAVSLSLALVFTPVILLVGVVLGFIIGGKIGMSEEATALLNDPNRLADAVMAALGPEGQMAFSLFALICFVAVIFVGVKLALVNAGTIGERKILVFQTWDWTKGNFWRVLAAIMVTSIPVTLVSGIVVRLVAMGLGGEKAGMAMLLVQAAIVGFIGAVANIPLIALAGHLYKGLRPQGFVAK